MVRMGVLFLCRFNNQIGYNNPDERLRSRQWLSHWSNGTVDLRVLCRVLGRAQTKKVYSIQRYDNLNAIDFLVFLPYKNLNIWCFTSTLQQFKCYQCLSVYRYVLFYVLFNFSFIVSVTFFVVYFNNFFTRLTLGLLLCILCRFHFCKNFGKKTCDSIINITTLYVGK